LANLAGVGRPRRRTRVAACGGAEASAERVSAIELSAP
jgi:hypothetical protein